MKKIYFLLVSFVSIFTFGQGLETFTNSNATNSYANNSFVGDNGITWTYVASRDQNGDANSSGIDGNALMLRRVADGSKVTSSTISGGVGNFSVKLYKGFTGGGDRQVEVFINGISKGTSPVFDDNLEHIFTVNAINQPGDIIIEVVNTTTKQVIVDDISWTGYTGVATPSLAITSPANSTVFNPLTSNVSISMSVGNFAVANGTGDGHIVYTINSGSPVDKFDTADIAVPTTAGQSYTVDLELVDNMGAPLSTPVTATVSFSVADITTVSSIAALRAGIEGDYYELSSEAVVTFTRPGSTTRNQKYIQDATAAILIDDAAETITNSFAIGQAMTGLKGRLSSYSGVLQIIPLEDITPATATFTITPEVVTIANITGDVNAYESELVQINGVTFADGDGINTFAANTNYDIADGTTMAFRSIFAEANYVVNTDLVPTGTNNLTVLVAEFNGTPQVVARSLADVTLSTNSFNAIEGLTMYPNPVAGNVLHFSSAANATMTVQIFDIVGKQVINTKVTNNTINTTNLNAGMYIVKITEEGKTATRKLVVK
ncbi:MULTISPECIES: T9SS type A sorting domain-containing protein [Flavobacterium]|uniref:T9SS type A sorting domain-containing protein n=1 Tax=Flavobacterium jumunjinense TaxID=998845 RepID=A0ABV5GLD0_9FLAO|nr:MULTISPECIES: T9SS type A sorting domain-containing protein [Flavobacterium]